MAETATIANLVIGLQARTDKLERDFKTARSKVDTFKKSTDTLRGAMVSLNTVMGAFGLSIGIHQTIGFFKDSFAAFQETHKSALKLQAVLEATGGVSGMSGASIERMVGSLEKLTATDDAVVRSGAAVLATFRQIGGEVFPQALKSALDMSKVMGTDLHGSVVQLGKALQDPIQGLTALRRVGVSFNETQIATIKALQKSGDLLGAQKIILAEVAVEFGGAAEKMTTAADRLSVSFDNLKESIGSLFETGGFGTMAGVMGGTFDTMTERIKLFQENEKEFGFAGAMGRLLDPNIAAEAARRAIAGPEAPGAAGKGKTRLPSRDDLLLDVDPGRVGAGPMTSRASFGGLGEGDSMAMDRRFANIADMLQDSMTMREIGDVRNKPTQGDRPAALLRGTAAAFSASFGQKPRPVEAKMLEQQKEQTRVLKNIEAGQKAADEVVLALGGV
jgi:hypothetical protein